MAAGDIVVVHENAAARKGNYFDGADDYVLHDAHAVARVGANDTVGTYTAWIYVDNISGDKAILSAGDNDSANESMYMQISNDRIQAFLKHGGATQFNVRQTTGNIVAKTWTHVAIVQDGVQPKLYVDGVNVAATNVTATDLTMWYDELTNCDKFAIGVVETNNTHLNDFKGAIGRVKYFSTNLTAREIKTESQGGAHTIEGATRLAAIETARVFDITMEDDGITDDGSGADDGTLTGNAHYGGWISEHSIALEANLSGHAAEYIQTHHVGQKLFTIIKKGD